MESINNQVQSVRQLLAIPQLAIPSYQRPYRWGSKNISDLFTDLATIRTRAPTGWARWCFISTPIVSRARCLISSMVSNAP